MNNKKDDRSTLDDLAQRTRIENEINAQVKAKKSKESSKGSSSSGGSSSSAEGQEDWSWGDIFGEE